MTYHEILLDLNELFVCSKIMVKEKCFYKTNSVFGFNEALKIVRNFVIFGIGSVNINMKIVKIRMICSNFF